MVNDHIGAVRGIPLRSQVHILRPIPRTVVAELADAEEGAADGGEPGIGPDEDFAVEYAGGMYGTPAFDA